VLDSCDEYPNESQPKYDDQDANGPPDDINRLWPFCVNREGPHLQVQSGSVEFPRDFGAAHDGFSSKSRIESVTGTF
jgi:hypothetical protein